MNKGNKKEVFRQAIPIFAVIFLGYLGYSLSLPLVPALFLQQKYSLVDLSIALSTRKFLLGLLLSMYPIGQFFGCPILGKLSDRFGRKPVLLVSLAGVIPFYFLTAFSIQIKSLLLLFISRIITGILEGNMVIAQASISDRSENQKQKAKYFGFLVSIASSAFAIGPLLGGKLSDSSFVSWFNVSIPFWAAGILGIFTLILVWILFSESKEVDKTISIKPKSLLLSYSRGFSFVHLRPIYLANFLLFMAIFFFFAFYPVFLVQRFAFSPTALGYVESYFALPFFISPFFFGKVSQLMTPKKVIQMTGLFLALFFIVFIVPHTPYALIFTLIPLGFFAACLFTFTALSISNQVNAQLQGEALGLNQSLQVYSEAATGILGGLLASIFTAFPIIIAAIFAFSCFLFLMILTHQKKKKMFHSQGNFPEHSSE